MMDIERGPHRRFALLRPRRLVAPGPVGVEIRGGAPVVSLGVDALLGATGARDALPVLVVERPRRRVHESRVLGVARDAGASIHTTITP